MSPTWLYWPLILPSGTVSATGGTTSDSGGYRYHTFTANGTFEITSGSGNCDILVVGGGGGGGRSTLHGSGGGGAGSMIEHTITLAGGTYDIVVGSGGAGPAGIANGGTGGASSFINNTGTTVSISATGGAGGARPPDTNGFTGGSGSGACGSSGFSGTGGTADTYSGTGTKYGNNGGNGLTGSGGNGRGGGGGGAGTAGSNATSGSGGGGGNGGNGRQWLDGVTYAGGGGGSTGASTGSSGDGGTGGGGNGGSYDRSATSGTANTGSGGGGSTNTASAGSGGSGIVIVRYPLSAAVLWMPTDLTGLQCWLDASDSSTITESGGSISLWEDKTANNYDADDAVNLSNVKITTKRPTVATAAQNSLDAINFNGSQHFDHNTARGMLKDRSCALMAVAMKYGSVSSSAYQFAWTNRQGTASGDTRYRFQLLHNITNTFILTSRRLDADSVTEFVETSSTPPYDTNWHIHVAVLDWAADTLSYYIDGSLIGTDSYPSGGANTSNTDLGTAADIWTAIGNANRSAANSLPLSSGSRIGEMICHAISSGSYATSDREKLEGYLAHKWGLEGNLPNGHPYKNAAP